MSTKKRLAFDVVGIALVIVTAAAFPYLVSIHRVHRTKQFCESKLIPAIEQYHIEQVNYPTSLCCLASLDASDHESILRKNITYDNRRTLYLLTFPGPISLWNLTVIYCSYARQWSDYDSNW